MFPWRLLLVAAAVLAVAASGGLVVWWLIVAAATAAARRNRVVEALARRLRRPAGWLLPLLGVMLALPAAALPAGPAAAVQQLLGLTAIGLAGWLLVGLIQVLCDLLLGAHPVDVRDNLAARQLETRVVMLRRILEITVGTVALAAMLMTFPAVQRLGASLLASAGLAGLVAGIAARPTLSNLIAGLQIALTQPIRIEDAVVVEGEWGWIEEITSTYVVVRIWDLRRLVMPLSYFIEQPFQNWTRRTADLLGTVMLYADYGVPVEEVRAELHRVLQETPLWDGKTWGLQVTEANDRSVELRCLMSAGDSGAAWDLRCHVRERLLAFLQQRHPGCLPRARLELAGGATGR